MLSRTTRIDTVAALVAAAFFLVGAPVQAGDRVRSTSTPSTSSANARNGAAPSGVVRGYRQASVVVAIAMPAAPPAEEPVYVGLRGPDGQVRRFRVEGGATAIQSPQVVLRPGQSVTIQWVAAR